MPSGHLVPRHRRSAKQAQALATVEAVKVGSPNEYWLAQRPLSTGSPNLV